MYKSEDKVNENFFYLFLFRWEGKLEVLLSKLQKSPRVLPNIGVNVWNKRQRISCEIKIVSPEY